MRLTIFFILYIFYGSISTAQCVMVDCKNDFGTFIYSDGTYQGGFVDGKKSGNGKFIWSESWNRHEGNWNNDLIYGKGAFFLS